MPLMKSASKKAFKHNMEAEMSSGKPQNQSLAISYDIQRRNKKKKMAEGGMVNESAKSEHRPMPEETDKDSKMVSRNSSRKDNAESGVLDQPTVKQAQRPSITPLSRPKMANGLYKVRDRDDVVKEEMMMSKTAPDGYGKQPDKEYDEEGADRQGPKVPDMQDSHSTSRKPYAKGGKVESSDYSHKANKYEDDLLDLGPSEDEGSKMARSHTEIDADEQNPNPLDMEREHSNGRKPYARGGEVSPQDEIDEEHHDSIAAAIMARRERQNRLMSDSDEDEMVMMADGGYINGEDSIYSDDSDQADLSRNAEEDKNMEDQASFDALRKENYSESEGLEQLDSPMDSNEHGHEIDSDKHNMISRIRSKMSSKRQFKAR